MNFQSLYNKFYTHKEGFWIMKPENAQALYKFVKEHDIKNVLDLGTGIGCSAAVIALALKEKGVEFHIDTVEQDEKCVNLAKELIPQELQENISIFHQPVKVWNHEKIPYTYFSTFAELPEVAGGYQLVVCDGPGPYLESGNYIDLPNGDVLKMLFEDKVKPGTFIFFDGRIQALSYIERYFAENFYILEWARRCHIIERKEGVVKFGDLKKEDIARVG